MVLLEKAPELGGTARKAAFWYWVPNNLPMRDLGMSDDETGCLHYGAALSADLVRPGSPDLRHVRVGVRAVSRIYRSASDATELLREHGALVYRHSEVPDYWAELPEDNSPKARVLVPSEA